jgi:two-component system cell cycle sensor histidine kinase/response regulator CckA
MAGRLSRVGAWSVELPSRKLTLSEEARTIQGMPSNFSPTVEEAIGCYAPECHGTIARAFESCARQGMPFDVELQITTDKGPDLWVRSIGEAERDATGTIRRVQGAIQDISDRKQAAEETRHMAERLTATLDSITDAFLTMDLDGRFTFMNDEAERLLGSRATLIGEVAWTAFPEAVGSTFQIEYSRAMAENRTVTFEEYFPPLGIWVSIRAYPSDQGLAVYFRDITENKRIAEALRESERRFSGVLDNLDLASMMLDTEGRITYCNDYLLELTGWAREEVLGRSWFDLFVPPDGGRTKEHFASLLRDAPEDWHNDNEVLVRGGGRRSIRWNNSVLRSASGEVIGTASIGEDVTERQRNEEQARQSQKMEAVGRLAGGVAHDFNNSLGVILGYTELLMRQAGESQKGKLEQILKATQRATGLTRQLLSFSRRQIVDPKVLDLNSVVADLELMLGRLIGEDIDLAIVAAPGLGQVKADPGQIEQVVVNLCVNARDAMPDGGQLRIETANAELEETDGAASHEPVAAGRYVMLAVTDAGCGIEKEILTQISEPFFTTKADGKGTGLGLAMVYGAVKQAGGYVWVYSEPGRGTTFKIYLPRIDEAVTRAVAEEPMPERGSETILLVEDESALRAIACEILEEHGYRVVPAAGGDEAVEIARRYDHVIHLLVTDVVMPGMNGRTVAESLVAARPELKVLYMSGYTDDVIAHRGVLEPGTLLLEKPFTAAAFLGRVREALGERGAA